MRARTAAILSTLTAAAVALAGCGVIDLPANAAPGSSAGSTSGQATGAPGSAAATLATLPVKGRAPKTGYARAQFGDAWTDTDRNGCDQRNDVLTRDLTDVAYKAGTRNCVVLTGTLKDPYGGATIAFTRGPKTSEAVQIDHVVALSDAWQTGAQQISADDRVAMANDLLNLMAVDGKVNRSKSDGDAATWLPPQKSFRCTYVARQVAVKARYHLWVTQAEHDAIARQLASCPDQPLP